MCGVPEFLSHSYVVSTITAIVSSILEKGKFLYKDYILMLISKFTLVHQLACSFSPSVHPSFVIEEIRSILQPDY